MFCLEDTVKSMLTTKPASGTSSNYFSKPLVLRQILIGKYRNVNSKVCAKFGGVDNNNFFLFPLALSSSVGLAESCAQKHQLKTVHNG
jgi:hypothetical protein